MRGGFHLQMTLISHVIQSGQTWIFYKAGQTQMTRQKRDPDDPTRFQPCYGIYMPMVSMLWLAPHVFYVMLVSTPPV